MSKHQIIHSNDYPVPIGAFYAAVADYLAYPKIIEPIRAVKVLRQDEKGARVRFDAHYFRDVHYTLDFVHRKPFELSWKLVQGDAFKFMTGAWEMEAVEECLTRVRYEAEIELHFAAPGFLIRRTLLHNVEPMMDAFFAHAQNVNT